jgi:hypothetical protein
MVLDFSKSTLSPCVIVSIESVFPVCAVVHESLCANLSSPKIFHSVYSPQWIGLALVPAHACCVCGVSWFYLSVTPLVLSSCCKLRWCACGFLLVVAGIILELSDKKAQVFLVLVELPWWFLEHAHKVFNEMLVRGKVLLWFGL